jgi:hypothetical protein
MLKLDVNRREFLKITAGAGAALAMPTSGRTAVFSKMIGIQSEMRLADLSGAGDAVRELKLPS